MNHFNKNNHQLGLLTAWAFVVCSLISVWSYGQEKSVYRYGAEILVGITAASNKDFVNRGLQKQLHFKLDHLSKSASYFKGLRSGVSLGITDLGNTSSLGYAITVMPYLEFPLFNRKKITLLTGLGASYFTDSYDIDTNNNNRAVSTDVSWSFRAFLNYKIAQTRVANYQILTGVFHHSNGHMKLPNNGYNSALIGISAHLNQSTPIPHQKEHKPIKIKSQRWYFEPRYGAGLNVFNQSNPFNKRKDVHTLSSEGGMILRNRFKIGVGGFYRFYRHYYDYINNNESLVQDGREFESFKKNPFWNASNIGVYIKGELLLNHVGLEILANVNIHKPAYKLDWRINDGWYLPPRDIPEPPGWQLGKYGSQYRIKKTVNTRVGVKYYLRDTQKKSSQNWYAGVFLNTNLGQADFSELALGYVLDL